jgi:hypothetical protein
MALVHVAPLIAAISRLFEAPAAGPAIRRAEQRPASSAHASPCRVPARASRPATLIVALSQQPRVDLARGLPASIHERFTAEPTKRGTPMDSARMAEAGHCAGSSCAATVAHARGTALLL